MSEKRVRRRRNVPWEIQVEVWMRIARGETDAAIERASQQTEAAIARKTVAQLRQEFEALSVATVVQLPPELQIRWSEITGKKLPALNTAVGNRGLPAETIEELLAFAQVLAGRLAPPLPVEASARGNDDASTWSARDAHGVWSEDDPGPSMTAVDRQWPSHRWDARQHPMFEVLRHHLGPAHPYWEALEHLEARYQNYVQASREARLLAERAVNTIVDTDSEDEAAALTDVALMSAFQRQTQEVETLATREPKRLRSEVGDIVWVGQFGASSVQRRERDEVLRVMAHLASMVDELAGSEEMRRLSERWRSLIGAVEQARSILPQGSALRRLLAASD